MSGLKSASTRLQTVFVPGALTNLLSSLCCLMQTLLHVMRKRKQKTLQDLKFHYFIGRFPVTSWQ